MFFMVAFITTLVPLLLFTTVGREETLIISTVIGFSVALIEMISHNGNDNLLIPITTYAFLAILMKEDIFALRENLIILIVIFVLVTIANSIKSWSKIALAEALVVGYLIVVLYGVYAVIPPLILFLTCMRFPKQRENEKDNLYDARIIETNVIIGITICGIATITGLKKELFMLYGTCFAMHLSVNTFVRLKYYFNYSEGKSLILSYIKGMTFIFLPSIIIQKLVFDSELNFKMLFLMAVLIFASCIMILIKKKDVKQEEITIQNGYMHMRIVGILIAILGVIQYFTWILD